MDEIPGRVNQRMEITSQLQPERKTKMKAMGYLAGKQS
jgi:hypothetical protein